MTTITLTTIGMQELTFNSDNFSDCVSMANERNTIASILNIKEKNGDIEGANACFELWNIYGRCGRKLFKSDFPKPRKKPCDAFYARKYS